MTSHFTIRVAHQQRTLAGGPLRSGIPRAASFQFESSAPTIRLGDSGIIIGHLFSRRDLGKRVTHIDPGSRERILCSSGQALVDEFWGGYVALIQAADGSVSVLRDPSGIMACYWRELDNEIILSNDIGSVASCSSPAKVDLPAVAQFLGQPDYCGDRTGLLGLAELPPGHALVIRENEIEVRCCWSPWQFVHGSDKLTFVEAVEQVRDVVQKCVSAWAACFDDVILTVSGGLDSSIVAAASAQETNLRCLTMYADDPEGDERRYATVLADAFGLPLQIGRLSLDDIKIDQPVLPTRPWPTASHFAAGTRLHYSVMEAEHPTAAYFTGNGGDNIFCSLRSTSPFLDRLLIEGPGFGLKKTLGDLCDLTETDTATVLKTAWKQYLSLRKPRPARFDAAGLAAVSMANGSLQHPWLSRKEDVVPGKVAHVGLLARAQQSHELYAPSSHAPHIAPLLSQPIVELCLSIPTWLWVDGGKNRAVARRAFEHILPDMITRRTSKGGPDGFMQSIYAAHSERIKSILREGLLAQSGYIDRNYLDAPDDPTWRGRQKAQRLLFLLGAETWCRHWNGR